MLLAKGLEFPPVHDIEVLLEIARQGTVILPAELQGAGSLTPYAVETRYPGSEETVTPEEVGKAIQLAERAVSWAGEAVSGVR